MKLNLENNRIDNIRPDAPELAPYGKYSIGVTTREFINKDQIDILNTKSGLAAAIYNRRLIVEIWYPAIGTPMENKLGVYEDIITCDGITKVSLFGRAIRDDAPCISSAPYPLVIISHGYPGNRFLMSHLAENLASKGYVVVSIDHTDSTYSDKSDFSSTLFNRPNDILFVLKCMNDLNNNSNEFQLSGMVDGDNSSLIGYSMGGYGVINAVGGGFNSSNTEYANSVPNKLLMKRQAGNLEYEESIDLRIKAAIAIAPWGWCEGFWDIKGLAGIRIPLFFMAGSNDTMVGYSPGVRNIFESCTKSDRYLLTFENAGHNAIAPIPAPKEVQQAPGPDACYWKHYADPVWDIIRTNNIAQHFITAFLGKYIKNDYAMNSYLKLIEKPNYSQTILCTNKLKAIRSQGWKGFKIGGNAGLHFEHRKPI